MNRLSIIIEKFGSGPEDFRCLYVGHNKSKSESILREPTKFPRAEIRGLPVRKNRVLIAEPSRPVEAPTETVTVDSAVIEEVTSAIEAPAPAPEPVAPKQSRKNKLATLN